MYYIMKIKHIFDIDEKVLEKGTIIISGWVNQTRHQQNISFLNLNDGSTPNGFQIVCHDTDRELFDKCQTIHNGCYIKVQGKIIKSPAKGQKYEMELVSIDEINSCDKDSYPLKKNVKLTTLRQIPHFRSKSKVFGCIYRIRNTLMYETHNFFQREEFLHLDPNVITTNECEGGAGVFTVTELIDNSKKTQIIDFKKDHFKKQTYLTVSSQLQLEALACGMGNCYTTNKSFRSEHSLTNKHVSEFTHLELEMIENTNDDLMDIGAKYIQYIIKKVYEKNKDDICELNKFISKGLLDRYTELLKLKFTKITYDRAVETIKNYSKIPVSYGDDLSSEMENFLTTFYTGAVFVYNWPFKIKSFYMKLKRNEDDDVDEKEILCENFDLLMPYGIGELIGGSMREHDYDILIDNMKQKNVDINGMQWYTDLRKYGTVPHGGFGLGLDRLLMMITGIQNIKDVIPFPVYYTNCSY